MLNHQLLFFLRYAAIAGNIILLIWFLFNRITEEFNGSIYQKFSSVMLIGLLAITIFFLLGRAKYIVQPSLLKYAVVVGNVVLLLWILFNGIRAGFRAPLVEVFYYIGVMSLLGINSILLLLSNPQQSAQPNRYDDKKNALH